MEICKAQDQVKTPGESWYQALQGILHIIQDTKICEFYMHIKLWHRNPTNTKFQERPFFAIFKWRCELEYDTVVDTKYMEKILYFVS